MSSSSIKNELADHIYQYLCHEAQYSDLPEAARESLTAASECIEQAYKLNSNQTNVTTNSATNTNNNPSNTTNSGNKPYLNNSVSDCLGGTKSSDILPDELLRIFTRHKEFLLAQQLDSLKSPLTINENDISSSVDKPDIRLNNNPLTVSSSNFNNDPHSSNNNNNNTNNHNCNPNNNATNPNTNIASTTHTKFAATSSSGASNAQQQQQPQASTSKPLSQHTISQLPMTTRKKLSHLRAQIKRQASKAARSRLEKRSSVSGVTTTGSGTERGANLGLGVSMDAGSSSNKHAGDGYNGHHHHQHHHHRELHNQPNSSSSTESPNAYSSSASNNQSTSSPATGPSSAGQPGSHNHQQASSSGNLDGASNPNMSPGQHNDGGGHTNSGVSGGGGLTGAMANLSAPGGAGGGSHHRHSSKEFGVSVHQKNFKQKLIALLKKFRTDGSDFDSEEQYREALERELMKAAAGRGSRAIEELLEEDIDVEGESGSEIEDWDNISESSTPKPSLRPFFSSTTLDKI